MSTLPPTPVPDPSLNPPPVNWGWFLGLGVALTLLGFLALGEAFAVTLGTVWIFGLLLLVGGVLTAIHAFYNRAWGGFMLELIIGVLYVVAGFAVTADPLKGAAVLTLLLGASFLINGICRVVLGLSNLRYRGAYLLLLGGLVSMALGGSILARWPQSSLYIIGLFVALELILIGVSWIALALTARQMRSVDA